MQMQRLVALLMEKLALKVIRSPTVVHDSLILNQKRCLYSRAILFKYLISTFGSKYNIRIIL